VQNYAFSGGYGLLDRGYNLPIDLRARSQPAAWISQRYLNFFGILSEPGDALAFDDGGALCRAGTEMASDHGAVCPAAGFIRAYNYRYERTLSPQDSLCDVKRMNLGIGSRRRENDLNSGRVQPEECF
jgi:hypothetical protein